MVAVAHNVTQAMQRLMQGTVQVVSEQELQARITANKQLVVKLGLDPTAPDLHLGHAIVLSKLKDFQDLGHKVVFLIGDFTARIGDPTGKSKTRPPLTEQEIQHNMQTYFNQVGKILSLDTICIDYNARWLDALTIKDMVSLCAKVTLARLTEREDFATRIQEHKTISFHELLYPLFQGYDSVALHADVELGGTDQTFNLLMGRFLQEHYGQKPQIIMTMPLLRGLDGVAKMSKSLGNAIGLAEPAEQAYGKLMSISDELMWHYKELLLATPPAAIAEQQAAVQAGTQHPMTVKKQIAHGIIARFWSKAEADAAQQQFEALFQKQDYDDAQECVISGELPSPVWIVELVKKVANVPSSSEARRLVESGAVTLDGQKITDPKAQVSWQVGMVIKVGKHKIFKLK